MDIKAKPLIDGKFWIIEGEGSKVGILQKNEADKFVFLSKDDKAVFKDMKSIEKKFGKNFFSGSIVIHLMQFHQQQFLMDKDILRFSLKKFQNLFSEHQPYIQFLK